MYANSIHLIDNFTHFRRGAITDVTVTSPWVQDAPGTVLATIHYDSGDIGQYQAVWNGDDLRPLEKLSIQPKGQRRMGYPD